NELTYNDNASPSTTASDVKVTVQAGQTYYIGVNGAIGTDGTDQHARDYNPLTGAGAANSVSLGTYTLVVGNVRPVVRSSHPPQAPSPVIGEVTGQVSISFGTPQFRRRLHHEMLPVTLTNLSGSPLQGAIWVVVENLPGVAKLRHAAGTTR